MDKLCKLVRVITVAPVAAGVTLTLLYFCGDVFYNTLHYAVSLLALTAFPLLAYPLSLIRPKTGRRRFQRSAAIVFSVAGYIAGLIFAFAANAPSGEKMIYTTYLLSGLAIALSSFLFHFKSSGHACGIAGPVALLMYFLNPLYIFGFLLLIPVSAASLEMKRHTLPELIAGGIIPILCLMISAFLF